MSQSNIMAIALFVAFIVFITMRGRLPKYLAVFGLGASTGASTPTVTPDTSSGSLFTTPFVGADYGGGGPILNK